MEAKKKNRDGQIVGVRKSLQGCPSLADGKKNYLENQLTLHSAEAVRSYYLR
jgi:hypothetical protein